MNHSLCFCCLTKSTGAYMISMTSDRQNEFLKNILHWDYFPTFFCVMDFSKMYEQSSLQWL